MVLILGERSERSGVSDKFDDIKEIVFANNMGDIFHLDSAYKKGCQFFFTSDLDILGKGDSLEPLLKIKIFNPHKEMDKIKVAMLDAAPDCVE